MSQDESKTEELSPVKRAILELREMRAQMDEVERRAKEPIAIVGMGCRFPGQSNNTEQLWQLLHDGVDAINEIPEGRWDVDSYYDPDPDAPGKMSTRWGGFIEDVDKFDADFFGISRREVESLDPQHRLLLEVSWEALEHAGQSPSDLFGSNSGVFIGIGGFDYSQLQIQQGDASSIDAYYATGFSHSAASGRLSYLLGLQGPAVSIDTACSSSLVAIHQACQSLRLNECNLALAGGVNMILLPELVVNFSKARMMAADGRCKTFSANADGYVRGEGCGMIVLKRLSDALANGDHIHALIRGSATNQDGRSSMLTAPSGPSQQTVIRSALENAGVDAAQIQYVEAHGTGTSLGDPIEVNALAAVLSEGHSADSPLMIGSIKTNIGHLEAAAGIAGLIKTVLAMEHDVIPPHLHLDGLNPQIPWSEIPVNVPTELTPWPSADEQKFAGVSSFGFSGTNAHVVLESAPVQESTEAEIVRSKHILTLSTKNDNALSTLAQRYVDHLETQDAAAFADTANTSNIGRAHLTHRLAVVAETAAEASDKLKEFIAGRESSHLWRGSCATDSEPEIAFLFTGQGSQWPDMGRGLYETQPVFRKALEYCDEILQPYMEQPLLSVLYAEKQDKTLLDNTAYTQPALFALEYALAELWQSWGVEPALVIGHSVGEYVAACVAGVFSLEDGLKLIAARGRLMQALPAGGSMVAVFADEAAVSEAIGNDAGSVSIAAINGPANTVISGEDKKVEAIVNSMAKNGVEAKALHVSHAFHSSLIEPMLEEFRQVAGEIGYSPAHTKLISNVTGKLIDDDQLLDEAYWVEHARSPVRFADGIGTLAECGCHIMLEVGPHPVLLGMARSCWQGDECTWLPSLRRGHDDEMQILDSLASLYVQGVAIDWQSFNRPFGLHKRELPTYPWQHKRYWAPVLETMKAGRAGQNASVWEEIKTEGLRQSEQCPLDLVPQSYGTKWRMLDEIANAYIAAVFSGNKLFTQAGERHTFDELLAQLQVKDTFSNLFHLWLLELVRIDWLQQPEEGVYVSGKPLPNTDANKMISDAEEEFQNATFFLEYIRTCGESLHKVLTGEMSALDTLFPGGTTRIADQMYNQWAGARYFNGIVKKVVDTIVKTTPGNRTLQMFEIGAGTGGTTANILPLLPKDRTVYFYTDLSEFFFEKARQKYSPQYPFLQYHLFNAENDPQEQGLPENSFDVIVAANVIHATKHLGDALKNVRKLLAPGGVLLLYETTAHPHWFTVTIALVEGWQRFEDGIRGNNPLISSESWQEVLLAHGFDDVAILPEPGSVADPLGSNIIVARAEGAASESESRQTIEKVEASEFVVVDQEPEAQQADTDELRQRLEQTPPNERIEVLIELVAAEVATILKRDESEPVDRLHRLMDIGIDSLMAVELRDRLRSALGLEQALPATLVFDYPTVEAIADYLARTVFNLVDEKADAVGMSTDKQQESNEVNEVNEDIANLSEEEVEAALLAKLEKRYED